MRERESESEENGLLRSNSTIGEGKSQKIGDREKAHPSINYVEHQSVYFGSVWSSDSHRC